MTPEKRSNNFVQSVLELMLPELHDRSGISLDIQKEREPRFLSNFLELNEDNIETAKFFPE